MAEYIDREALLNNGIRFRDGLSKGMLLYVPLVDVKRSIKNFPEADVVKVVRCQDCLRRGNFDSSNLAQCCHCGHMVHRKDFCSYGVRKKGLP